MILFKRIGGSFREITSRDWALLSLETLGIIGGILIAFELNEWASRRKEAARHDRLMERLHEVVELAVTVLRGDRDLMKGQLEGEKQFAAELSNGVCPARFDALGTVNRMPALTAPTSVYQELMGAGGLSSIERKDVRDRLTMFHDTMRWAQSQIDYFRSVRIRPIDEGDPRMRYRFDPKAEDPASLTFDRQALCNDQGFKNRVAAATRNHTVYVSFFQSVLENAIALCVRLGDSLGKTCIPTEGGPLKGDDAKVVRYVIEAMRRDKARSEND